MEMLEEKIKAFLITGSYGYGDGYGYGNGDGYGYGNGDGNGDGNGYGYGILKINGYKVHKIDDIPTIITSIKGNIAKGYTILFNTQLIPCYIAKVGNFFAHGKTSHEALLSAQEKYDEKKPLSERISDTIRKYPTLDTIVPHQELYSLHHVLTGSCKFGRDEFCKAHGLDPTKGSMTMRDFLLLTKDSYGSDAILLTAQAYGLKTTKQ